MKSTTTALLGLCLAVVFASAGAPLVSAEEQVIGRPNVDVYVPNNQVTPGEETTLEVFLSNDGELRQDGAPEYVDRVTTARGTVVELDAANSPITFDTGAIPVGTLPTGTAGPLEVSLTVPEGTPPGTYEVPVEVRYSYTRLVTYGDGEPEFSESSFSGEQTVTIRVVDAPRFEVVDTQSTTQIGDRGEVTLTLRNVGTEPARDARVSLASSSDELAFGTDSSSADSFVGSWRPGETKQVTYALSATDDAIQREYSLTSTVDYTDVDGVRQTSTELVTGVTPRAEQSFALSALDSTLRVGQEGTISGTITNEGPSTVTEPVLVVSGGSQNLDFTETEYALSTLASGDSESFSFEADVSDAATAGRQQFSFQVRYQNGVGDDRTSDTLRRAVDVDTQRDRFTVEPVQSTLERGGSDTVTLRVTNNGAEPVTEVSVKTYFTDPLSSSDDEAFVPSLDPGESAEIQVAASAGNDALTKQYPMSADIQYTTPDGDTELSNTYKVAIDVVAADGGGGGLPLPAIFGVVAVAAVGIVVWRRRG
ncbi:COG1361 S-layer family protein [Salinigranum halophilum]|uniref:COG1361 S-layer family protein n=1 Tax=Salinigranum halophilum TaxID=2565931 RepID=UPI0010A80270|nr:COG1361 S-layer family protein [Salinigranum halophilum]